MPCDLPDALGTVLVVVEPENNNKKIINDGLGVAQKRPTTHNRQRITNTKHTE